ncbi:MAG TPA: cyclopropane-fatty-acyl-phospholipid synthase family protein, partial [Candidatus Limnocylindrales bacterium]|nr:cyclopropane-fatty-acyl-phospholipid synthase family protein [Candidatus Limnocylindrales bacterium]
FGEAYMAGEWVADDLAGVLSAFASRLQQLVPGPLQRLRRWYEPLQPGVERNTPAGARANIARHYDLSNELFALFLDETMTYSCAVFGPGDTLADAQRRKYQAICDLAAIGPGDHVLEIGTGWGGMAMHAAGHAGCRLTSITISREQRDLALARINDAGLADRVDVQLCDYRDVRGRFDAIVSIEMFEAVGAEYFSTFFEACERALKPGGRMSLQTIAFPDVAFEPQRRGANWIQTYIFPGGLLPSLAAIERALHRTHLLIRQVEDIAPHYVRTLATWRRSFFERIDDVRALGFDERFIRTWDYYLSISEAGFDTGVCQDFQIVFEKGRALRAHPAHLTT